MKNKGAKISFLITISILIVIVYIDISNNNYLEKNGAKTKAKIIECEIYNGNKCTIHYTFEVDGVKYTDTDSAPNEDERYKYCETCPDSVEISYDRKSPSNSEIVKDN